MTVNCEQLTEVVTYVEGFYGNVPDAIYPIGATLIMILEETQKCWNIHGIENFCGDTVDRERVRDIMIKDYGLEWK